MTLGAGTQIGPYEVISPLGAGGMGEVWRARDTRLNREVAIKVLPPSFATDEDRLRRFEQEALATSALNHLNILTVYDIGTHDGAPYIVAELLEGEELREQMNILLKEDRPGNQYAVTSDGQRFLINSPIAATGGSPISVVINWTAEGKK
jgi:serine/threonine protein kinase